MVSDVDDHKKKILVCDIADMQLRLKKVFGNFRPVSFEILEPTIEIGIMNWITRHHYMIHKIVVRQKQTKLILMHSNE